MKKLIFEINDNDNNEITNNVKNDKAAIQAAMIELFDNSLYDFLMQCNELKIIEKKEFYIHLNTQDISVVNRCFEYLEDIRHEHTCSYDIQMNMFTITCYDLTSDNRLELYDIFQQYDIDITY